MVEEVALRPSRDHPGVGAGSLCGEFETSARWSGTAWTAALAEARAHLALAEGEPGQARLWMDEAVSGFELAGQPYDASRCRRTREELVAEALPG